MKYIKIYEELTAEKRLRNRKSNAIKNFLFFVKMLFVDIYGIDLFHYGYDLDLRRNVEFKKGITFFSFKFLESSLFRDDVDKTDFIYIYFTYYIDEYLEFYYYILYLIEEYAIKHNDDAREKDYPYEDLTVADLAMLERGFYALKPEDLKEIIQNKKEDFELWKDTKKYNL